MASQSRITYRAVKTIPAARDEDVTDQVQGHVTRYLLKVIILSGRFSVAQTLIVTVERSFSGLHWAVLYRGLAPASKNQFTLYVFT